MDNSTTAKSLEGIQLVIPPQRMAHAFVDLCACLFEEEATQKVVLSWSLEPELEKATISFSLARENSFGRATDGWDSLVRADDSRVRLAAWIIHESGGSLSWPKGRARDSFLVRFPVRLPLPGKENPKTSARSFGLKVRERFS